MEYIIFVVSIFAFLYWLFTKNFNHWKIKNVPYNNPIPFFGNMAEALTLRYSFGEIFQRMYENTKEPIFGLYVFHKPCLLLRDPQIIKKIFITDFQYFSDRNILNNKRDDPVSAHTLFILKNPDWKEMRPKISPLYTSSKMKMMSNLIENSAHEMVGYITKEVTKNPIIEMKEIFSKFMINVIASTTFGIQADSFKNKKSRFYTEAKRMVNWDDFMTSFRFRCYFIAHTLVKMFRMKMLDPISAECFTKSFWDIMNERASSKICRNDLIDIFLQLKEKDNYFKGKYVLVSQAILFLVAGFETTSSTLAFALYELAKNPEIQKKLREEILEISESHGGINYDTLKEMVYLDMCIKEVLRKYPALPVVERKNNVAYTISETGTTLDKETAVFVSVLGLHYDEKYFPNPEIFLPDRFSPENKHKIENCTYLPFGDGPRNCLGKLFAITTMKFGVANLLKNFVLEFSSETVEKIAFNKNGVVLSPIHGINLKVSKI